MKLTDTELERVTEAQKLFQGAKMKLGDLEMSKFQIMQDVEDMKMKFATLETELVEKYGETSTINMQTGEVTHKK